MGNSQCVAMAIFQVCKGVQGMRGYVDDYNNRIVLKNELSSAWKDTTDSLDTDRL